MFNEDKDLIEYEKLKNDLDSYAKTEGDLMIKIKNYQTENYKKLTEETNK